MAGFRIVAQSAGVRINATSTESTIDDTMVIENWRKITPVEPLKNAIGRNTADRTRPMPTSAPLISSIDFLAASLGLSPSSWIRRSTFSTTTIASSTSRPIASTMPNKVSVLIVNPASWSTASEPSSTTGTAIVGISVARKFWRNRNITRKTRTIASTSVWMTCSTDSFTNVELSTGKATLTSGGNCLAIRFTSALTSLTVSSALAPGASFTPKPAACLPL